MFNRFSTNGSPVNIRFPQGFELPPQYFILRTLCTGIMLYNIFGYRTDVLQQLSVTAISRNFQIEGDTTLLRPFKSPGPRNFKSKSFRYFKAVISPHHYLQSLTSIFGQFIICHQNTIRLVGSAPHTATQLMEL